MTNKLPIILVGLSLIILGFAISQGINYQKTTNLQSQCYTSLQPTTIFPRVYSPLTENHLENSLKINIGREFYITHTADTGSMKPTIGTNADLLFIVPKEDEIKIGDIIEFICATENNNFLMHRVIDIKNGIYITKGDNNGINDMVAFNCSTHFNNVKGKLIGVLY